MKSGQNFRDRNDWLYEFRPMLYLLMGLLGLINGASLGDTFFLRLSQVSGVVLIIAAWKVYQWRKDYRRSSDY